MKIYINQYPYTKYILFIMSSFNRFNRLVSEDSDACEQPVQPQINTMSSNNRFNNLLSEDSDSEEFTVVSRKTQQTNTQTAAKNDWQLAKTNGKTFKKSDDKGFKKSDDKGFKKRENTNQVFINTGIVRFDVNKASVHPKVYNYIKDVFKTKSSLESIHAVMNIGVSRLDKIIGLANLFFLAVRGDKIAIMQNIIDMVQRGERQFIVNAYDRKYTPIMQAAYNGCDQSVKLLLIWGADTKQINCDGEDVFTAAQSGMEMMIQNHPSMEILIEAKFKKITDFISSWDPTFSDDIEQKDQPSIAVAAASSTDEVSYEYNLINPSDDIVSQFTEILESCIEDCNNVTMKKLFDDINNLIVNGFDIEKIRPIIEENREYLEDDFSAEFSLLAI